MRTSILFPFSFFLFTFPSLALTREEIVERFRATPVVQVDGLVQVVANCPADMRRAYQLPVASYAAGVCRSLYASERLKPTRFAEPGIVICIGGDTNVVTNVAVRVSEHIDGSKFTKIFLPAPGSSDRRALALAVAQGYFLAVHGKTLDDKTAWHALLSSDPGLRTGETCARLADWSQRGVYADGMDDEDYLVLSRKVLLPGQLTKHELNQFASRLYLYPLAYDAPFCGKYLSLDFKTAVRERKRDLSIRFAAFVKAKQILVFGAGRGEALQSAADAYALFLTELGRDEKTDGELLALLATAEDKLRGSTDVAQPTRPTRNP